LKLLAGTEGAYEPDQNGTRATTVHKAGELDPRPATRMQTPKPTMSAAMA